MEQQSKPQKDKSPSIKEQLKEAIRQINEVKQDEINYRQYIDEQTEQISTILDNSVASYKERLEIESADRTKLVDDILAKVNKGGLALKDND